MMLRGVAGLALLCILLRGFIPSGYMPDLDQSRDRWFALVLCASAGPMPMPMAMHVAAGDRGDVPAGVVATQADAHHVAQMQDDTHHDTHHDTMMHAGQDCPFAVAVVQPFVGGLQAAPMFTVPVRVALLAPVTSSQHILPPPRAPPLGSRAPPSITV
ncbi:DUF2946 family protein [Schauerella aestuarii]|uniref:DUF2946 family protein n=1 Tax=Schauerella aestuarii TaxID=2511204 RepID=UPI00136F1FED|nr:DUF2946 family protein [Achromobacter aestuarii]MYZ41521.1 hypothetical protein [Achromobacter aestuarii]